MEWILQPFIGNYTFYTDILCLDFGFDDRGSSTITTTTKEEEALCLDQALATAEGREGGIYQPHVRPLYLGQQCFHQLHPADT